MTVPQVIFLIVALVTSFSAIMVVSLRIFSIQRFG